MCTCLQFIENFTCRDPSLQVRACNLLGGYLTHKETNMRYISLETLSHLAISDLSREAVKKHQEVVLKALKVSLDTVKDLRVQKIPLKSFCVSTVRTCHPRK